MEPLRFIEPPKNVVEVQRVLGILGYLRKFIRNYADLAKPIYDVIKKAHRNAGGKLTPTQRAMKLGRAQVVWTAEA